jgi:hypothetical protein
VGCVRIAMTVLLRINHLPYEERLSTRFRAGWEPGEPPRGRSGRVWNALTRHEDPLKEVESGNASPPLR